MQVNVAPKESGVDVGIVQRWHFVKLKLLYY